MSQKIVINRCYGGFSLSQEALDKYHQYSNFEEDYEVYEFDIKRDDPILIKVVEELGVDADGSYASLYIVEIPDGVYWHIHDYDGMEHVAENHRTWY